MMTQSETIIWHKYPDEKPEKYMELLVCAREHASFRGELVIHDYIIVTSFYAEDHILDVPAHWSENVDNYVIIAWAEMPKGWKE